MKPSMLRAQVPPAGSWITGKVFERMRAERDRLVKQFNGEGEAKSLEIRSDANRKRDELLGGLDRKIRHPPVPDFLEDALLRLLHALDQLLARKTAQE